KLCRLEICLQGLNLVLSNHINDSLCSSVLCVNHIAEAAVQSLLDCIAVVVYGILEDIGLCGKVVIHVSYSRFCRTAAICKLCAQRIKSVAKLSADSSNSALDTL